MTLDQAIEHAEHVAKENETHCKLYPELLNYKEKYFDAEKCAAEHRQLALWLKELKAYRQAWERIPREIEKKQLNTGDPSESAAYGDSLEIIKRNLDELMEGFDG